MKAAPLLISFHNDSQPIYSVHFDPHGRGRLATAGGDNNIRLWQLERDGEEAKVSFLATLMRHTQTVNVVRFCPKGEMLASAGDDGNVLLWVPSDVPMAAMGEEHADDKEHWRIKHMCRTTTGAEIYDLAWSPDGRYFITGAMDNTARIFDAQSGAMIRQIAEHHHYVQGVAWDPLNEYVATQSSDRSVHIYSLKMKDGTCSLTSHAKFNKMDLPGRRVSTQSPAPSESLPHRASNASASGLAIASPAPSNPGTPMTTPAPMNPPASASSRRSSFGSSPAFRRSASPAPSLPLPAVRPEISSPSLNAAMGLAVRNTNIYHNETLTSFFRRLTFAPDGSLLFTPSGQYKSLLPLPNDTARTNEEIANTVYIYTRAGLNKPPVAHLPGHKKPSVAVRCSPIFYNLRAVPKPTTQITIDIHSEEIPPLPEAISSSHPSTFMEPPSLVPSESVRSEASRPTSSPKPPDIATATPEEARSAFSLPYRMVYAVATQDAVFIYDTQQTHPLCVVSSLHYATFTDLAWSNDGLTLIMSSSDGFCSTITFAPSELGAVYQGAHPTYHHPHPTPVLTQALPSPSATTPLTTPTAQASPSLTKAMPAFPPPSVPPAAPSPAPSTAASFSMRPGSPTRSNSQSSIVTMASSIAHPAPSQAHSVGQGTTQSQTSQTTNYPTPIMSSIPSVAVPSMTTPPQTPAASTATVAHSHHGGHSAASSISGSVLGKRDAGAASESEREDAGSSVAAKTGTIKRRRVAPQLVGSIPGLASDTSTEAENRKEERGSMEPPRDTPGAS